MKRLILLFVSLTIVFFRLASQDTVLEKDTDEQYQEKRGPNMRQYGQMYEGFAMVVPYNNVSGAEADPLRSGSFTFGYRYKLKLLSFYAIGYDLSTSWTRYGIKPEASVPVDIAANPLSQASQVKRLSLAIASFGAEAYNRINIGKRGNVLGNYIDFGIRGEWNYGRRLIIKEKVADGAYYGKSRTEQSNLNFIEKFSTMVTARVGVNKIMLYGSYRLSDLIVSGFATPELPPVIAGLQVGF